MAISRRLAKQISRTLQLAFVISISFQEADATKYANGEENVGHSHAHAPDSGLSFTYLLSGLKRLVLIQPACGTETI